MGALKKRRELSPVGVEVFSRNGELVATSPAPLTERQAEGSKVLQRIRDECAGRCAIPLPLEAFDEWQALVEAASPRVPDDREVALQLWQVRYPAQTRRPRRATSAPRCSSRAG
jgi:hypothetical protein